MTKYKSKFHEGRSGNLFRSITNKCCLSGHDMKNVCGNCMQWFWIFLASLPWFPWHKTVTLIFVPSGSKFGPLLWRSQISRSSAYHSGFVLRRSWVPNLTGFSWFCWVHPYLTYDTAGASEYTQWKEISSQVLHGVLFVTTKVTEYRKCYTTRVLSWISRYTSNKTR